MAPHQGGVSAVVSEWHLVKTKVISDIGVKRRPPARFWMDLGWLLIATLRPPSCAGGPLVKHCHSTPVPFRTQATIRRLAQDAGLPLARYLSSEQVVTACRAAGHGWRERLYSPAVTLWMFLTQMLDPDHSCRKAVARFLAYRLSLVLRPCSSKDGAYSEARSRLPEQAVSALTRHTGHTLAESASPAWLRSE